MSTNPFTVSIKMRCKTLPQAEYFRGKIQSVDSVAYDVQGENGKRFVLGVERGTDRDPAYVIVLLDGVVSDHFFVDSWRQSIASPGWRRSLTAFHAYQWAPRNQNREDRENFRVRNTKNASTEVDLTGYITLRFYRMRPTMRLELQHRSNFLEKHTRQRHNKPLMSCYAVVSRDITKSITSKLRLPPKAWTLGLPVPFFQVLFRYNDGEPIFAPLSTINWFSNPLNIGEWLEIRQADGFFASSMQVRKSLRPGPHSALLGSKRKHQEENEGNGIHPTGHRANKQFPRRERSSSSRSTSVTSMQAKHHPIHKLSKPSALTSPAQLHCQVFKYNAQKKQKRHHDELTTYSASGSQIVSLRNCINETLRLMKNSERKGDIKGARELLAEKKRYEAELENINFIDLTI